MRVEGYSPEHLQKFNALGVSQYGQMTAGSYMYIGPQGIVHGTTITILNAGRRIQPGTLAEIQCTGCFTIWANDGWIIYVYWSARNCTWNNNNNFKCG